MRVLQSSAGGEIEATRNGIREIDRDAIFGTRKRFNIAFLVGPEAGDPADVGEEDALAAVGIPTLRDLRNSAYCMSKAAREVISTQRIWEVVCSFDSKASDDQPTEVWSWTSEVIDKVLQRDPITGNPIVNAVGEPLLITAPISIPILTVEKLVDTFDPDMILDYENKCNLTTFYGAPPGCALCSQINDDPADNAGSPKRRLTTIIKFDLSIDPDTGLMFGWGVQLLNHGTKYMTVSATFDTPGGTQQVLSGHYAQFVDLLKNPTTGNLNLNGTARDHLLPPIWLPYNRHPRAELNDLDLGPF